MSEGIGYEVHEGGRLVAVNQFSYEEFLVFWPKMKVQMELIRPLWRHWNEDYIHCALASNALTLWGCGSPPNAEFVFFLQVCTYPARRVLAMPLAFGNFREEMVPLLDGTVENYARTQACDEIEIHGRRGWMPHLKAIGFKHQTEVWTRPVANLRAN